jgi:hypothetical protein
MDGAEVIVVVAAVVAVQEVFFDYARLVVAEESDRFCLPRDDDPCYKSGSKIKAPIFRVSRSLKPVLALSDYCV